MKTVARFPYSPGFDPDFGLVFEPIIPVVFVLDEITLEFYPYLDSGADITVLPYRFGAELGLSAAEGIPLEFTGEGGGIVPLTIHRVGLRIGESNIVPVRVGWAQTEGASLLLGRLDVFNHFTFEFNHAKQEIRVKQ
ncbi:MAG: hypothetical protein HY327_00985 [Chloroflexi bacterium]|nr:hypothetical protein [Chloroflexota bacterium]